MANVKLAAQPRTIFKKGHTRSLRVSGLLPATVSGKAITEPVSVQVSFEDLKEIMKSDAGSNAIIDLDIDSRIVPVMVSNIQFEPRTRKALHVDFQAVKMDQKVRTTVPVHLSGDPVGVKTEGGQLEQIHNEVAIYALPGNVPTSIDLDISGLHVGESIKFGDVSIAGVELDGTADEPIALIRGGVSASMKEEDAESGAADAEAASEA